MGDRPIEIPKDNYCPLGPYTNGMEPDYVGLTLTGIKTGDEWIPGQLPPPNGTYKLRWVRCGKWETQAGGWNFSIEIFPWQVRILVQPLEIGRDGFYQDTQMADVIICDNYWDSREYAYWGGQAKASMYLTSGALPASWDGADLIGVPKQSPYFAEELPTDIASRKLRYACHRDKTNVKLFLE